VKSRWPNWVRFSAAALAFVCLSAAKAEANDIVLNAVSYADMPLGRTVAVEILDDSQKNLDLKKQFEDELKAAGFTLDSGARLIMTIETRDESGSWSGGGSTSLIDLANSDNHTGTDAPDVRVRIFDTQRGGILNQKREYGVTEVSPSQFRINASLEDRTNGRRIWEGWSIVNIDGTDDPALQRAMVTPIVKNIGNTVRDEKIPGR
jgi:hypothetical protein